MATPLTADRMVAALRAEGVDVVEHRSWRTHNRNHMGAFGPVNGIIIHHTAGVGSGMVDYCYDGDASLPGPVCHAVAARDARIYLVGNGRANHAGKGSAAVLDRVIAESGAPYKPGADEVDGNVRLYGIEVEHWGDSRPYPAEQYEQVVRWAAGICRAHGWSANSIIGHKEWTRRKPDPSFSMDQFRADVAARLGSTPTKPTTPTGPDVSLSRLISAARTNPAANGTPVTYPPARLVEISLASEGLLDPSLVDGHYGTATVRAYAAWQRRLGYTGTDADGIPGETSLRKLGNAHGFTVGA
ncbi:N-acetylmuramoyl-L-alanine amidase [Embleya sp. MST-111070]|uniref:N-acetylmuramoyl-L-alanine amidase n=1 Tax=Embleya sp. MST-111070 TaxID=3398231 RepID=UPI003F73D1B4